MKNCRTCIIIRFFLASVLLLIIIGLSMTDNLHYLSYVTSWNAAILVLVLGLIIFLVRFFEYLKTKD